MTAAVVDTLARLVAYPTVSDRPLTDLAGYLAERAEAAGMRVERFETAPGKCNVVAAAGPGGTGGITLSGHMDVVPTSGQSWTSDPFELTERDGRLYGRGACDMKGFLAAVTDALSAINLKDLRRELVLVWTHDEEVGCLGSAALASQIAGRPLPAATWIGEPTGFQICRLHPGHTTVRVACLGRPAHSSRPQLGLNAIAIAGEVLAVLAAFGAELAREPSDLPGLACPWTVVNPGLIQGGAAVNIVPERCDVRVGLRPLPGQDTAALLARLSAALAPLDAHYRTLGGSVTLHPEQDTPALLTAAGTPLESLLLPHAASAEIGGAPFATDGGNLAKLGCEPLIFGPGSIDVAHRPDEYIAASALLAAQRMVEETIFRRCVEA